MLQSVLRRILIVGLMVAYSGGSLLAEQSQASVASKPTPPSCSASEYRQFDFWQGSWNVTGANGKHAGTNRITQEANGCALVEHWAGAGGGHGMSLNYYDPADQEWHQDWVGSGGSILHLSGGLEGGAMIMTGGDRKTPRGPVRDRIRWTPREDGSVLQEWSVSTDGGTTWKTIFAGKYRRVTSSE